MKKLFLCLAFISLWMSSFAQVRVTFTWVIPPATNYTVNVYKTTDTTIPTNSWPLLFSIYNPRTNVVAARERHSEVFYGKYFTTNTVYVTNYTVVTNSIVTTNLPVSNVTLAWEPSVSAFATGYKIYRGGKSQTYTNVVNVGNVTNATVGGLTSTNFFAATAYDAAGNESVFSNEVQFNTFPTYHTNFTYTTNMVYLTNRVTFSDFLKLTWVWNRQ
jgi:hypothetical protein